MKFVVVAEGQTEQKALPPFLKRWLDPRLMKPVGVKVSALGGWAEYLKSVAPLSQRFVKHADVIAVVGLIDLYGPIYPAECKSIEERCAWLKQEIAKKFTHPKFMQHLAVHEFEAWLFSDPGVFPAELRKHVESKANYPERVDFDKPPKKLLKQLYRGKLDRDYKPTTETVNLFAKLDPENAASRCPALRALLDDLFEAATRKDET